MNSSFIDAEWTNLTHQQIYREIVAELEEQQCKEEGHRWYPVFICRTCGETFDINEECKMRQAKEKQQQQKQVTR